MKTLIIKELTGFKEAARKDILIDCFSRPIKAGDPEIIFKLTIYGNSYLHEQLKLRENRGLCLWFDIHFDREDGLSEVGMTWAYNPRTPNDPITGLKFFWRMWSEVIPSDGRLLSLTQTQQQLGDYLVPTRAEG